MADTNYKNWAIGLGIVAGVLAIAMASAVVMYRKKVADGDIVVKPTVPGGTTAAPKTTTTPNTLPAGSRVAQGTFVSVPDPTAPGGQRVVDLYAQTN